MLYKNNPYDSKLYRKKPYKSDLYDKLTVPENKLWSSRRYSSHLYEGGKNSQELWEDGNTPLPPFDNSGIVLGGAFKIDVGKCLNLDEINSTGEFTVNFWADITVPFTNGSGYLSVINTDGPSWPHYFSIRPYYINPTRDYYYLRVNGSSSYFFVNGHPSAISSGLAYYSVLFKDGDFAELVINGNPYTPKQYSSAVMNFLPFDRSAALNTVVFGAIDDFSTYSLSNVSIYKKKLTYSEIQSIMNKNYIHLTSSEKDSLLSWWNLVDSTDGVHYPDSHGPNHGIKVP